MNDAATMEEEGRMGRLNQARREDTQVNEEGAGEQKKPERINNVTTGLMIAVALLYDGAQAVLEWLLIGFAVNWILNIWAWLTFFVWFKLKDVSFANPKRALAQNGAFLLEFIPVVEELPIWTAAVLINIITVRAEDKLSAISPEAGKLAAAATGGK